MWPAGSLPDGDGMPPVSRTQAASAAGSCPQVHRPADLLAQVGRAPHVHPEDAVAQRPPVSVDRDRALALRRGADGGDSAAGRRGAPAAAALDDQRPPPVIRLLFRAAVGGDVQLEGIDLRAPHTARRCRSAPPWLRGAEVNGKDLGFFSNGLDAPEHALEALERVVDHLVGVGHRPCTCGAGEGDHAARGCRPRPSPPSCACAASSRLAKRAGCLRSRSITPEVSRWTIEPWL